MPGRHRIGRLRCKVVLLQGQEKVGERLRDLPLLLPVQVSQDIGHGGPGLRPPRVAEEGLQIVRIHPRSDRRETGRLLRSPREWRLAGVTGDTVQLFEQNEALEIRIELTGEQPGNDHFRTRDRDSADQCSRASHRASLTMGTW